jgi:hypothetical protein
MRLITGTETTGNYCSAVMRIRIRTDHVADLNSYHFAKYGSEVPYSCNYEAQLQLRGLATHTRHSYVYEM